MNILFCNYVYFCCFFLTNERNKKITKWARLVCSSVVLCCRNTRPHVLDCAVCFNTLLVSSSLSFVSDKSLPATWKVSLP